jgi:hypothetical protein
MEKKFYLKNAGFPPIKFCKNEENDTINNKKERFFQNNTIHNINIRQLLSENSKKTIIVPIEDEALEVVDTFNRS